MARIVFMGTPDFAVPALQALIDHHTVVGVITQPDRPAGRGRQMQQPPVRVVAEASGIPVYQPTSLRSEEAAAPLQAWRPELIVVAAFGQILRPHVLDLPPKGCLNVHASLLPRWRGAAPIQHAILAGDQQTGISLMRMDVGLDTGPVYVQESLTITDDETAATLHDRLARLGGQMLARYLEPILAGQIAAAAQDERQSTYAPMIKKEMGLIDWQQPVRQIDRLIRAMTPWPGAYTFWQGNQLKILSATPVDSARLSGPPGLVTADGDQLMVLAGQGGLRLRQLQLAGKRPLAAEAFVRGRPDLIGSRLGQSQLSQE
jgi:methionyl-tRNA formyltransferase